MDTEDYLFYKQHQNKLKSRTKVRTRYYVDSNLAFFEFKQKVLYINENHIDIDLPDPKDVVFYEVVMEQRESTQSWLVTGNIKHFPNETFIVTPRQMLDIILNEDMD